ncbi:hypothetical protein [Tolypothrix sp. PCC 7601]|uniref:hypothetical protein n=2 Tax=Tolypothrix TaxID=111782 RepID=UPI0005F8721D|nr:hypothetical protein [Tolypothrix sp. PCC 7601]
MAKLGRVWQEFQSYSGNLQTYLRNNLRQTLKPVEIQAGNAINQSVYRTIKYTRSNHCWYFG